MISLRHFSRQEGLTTIDPSHWGEGFSDAARKRGGVPRSYFYVEGTPYEPALSGLNPYEAQLPSTAIYNITEDPLGLVAQAKTPHYPGAPTGSVDPIALEALVQKAGFPAMTNGNVVMSFNPVPVRALKKP